MSTEEPPHARLQIVCAVLLAIGGAGSAWCSFEASLWSGEQAQLYASAGAKWIDSARHSTRSGQLRLVDATLFVAWAHAYTSDSQGLGGFFAQRFRPEFKTAFDEWLKSRPLENAQAAPTPFALPSYRVEEDQISDRLAGEAKRAADEARQANHNADRYARSAVIFALALVFAGSAQVFGRRNMPWVVVAMSVAMMLIAVAMAITLPKRLIILDAAAPQFVADNYSHS